MARNKRRKGLRKAFSWLMVLCMVMTMGMFTAQTASADRGDTPEHHKMRESNGDGTYRLELSVTGDAETEIETAANVNVLIVYDESSSMTSNNVTTNPNRNRADYAEDVVHDFIESLSRYQSGDGSNIQVALVGFGPQANGRQTWTSNLTGTNGVNRFFDDGVDGTVTSSHNYTRNNGTNWEAALQQAQTYLNALDTAGDTDPTFVILVTDGACTASGNGSNAIAPSTTRPWTDYRPFYQAARDEALAIENRNDTTLFGIYAYGREADLLDDLVYYAQNGSDRTGMDGGTDDTPQYYNASDTAALNEAIEEIFQKIVETLGVSAVSITDGTTSGVTTSSGTIDLLEVDEGSYEYWLDVPYNTGNNTFTRKNLVTGDNVTYRLVDNGDGTVTVMNGTTAVTTVTGTMSMGSFKYKWEKADALYDKAPPAAHFTGTSVDWDLSTVGTLLDGVTYSVTFDVYPSQETYDMIADLKNDKYTYDSLDPEIKKWLKDEGNHSYTLETNTGASLSWTDTREENPTQHTQAFTEELPRVATDAEQMDLEKIWIGSYKEEQMSPVTLDVMRGTEKAGEITLSPNEDPEKNFKASMYIATGLMRVDEEAGTVEVLDEGHDYQLKETGDVSYHWDLDFEILHPMIIDGTLTMLKEVDSGDIPAGMGDKEYYSDGSAHYYKIGDNIYTEGEGSAALTATNVRRSDLNLTKTVTGDKAPADAEFTFNMTVTDPNGDDVWFSVWNGDYVDALVSGATKEMKDGEWTGFYYAPSGSSIVVKLKAGDNLRFTNMPIGTTYSFTETDLPEGFLLTTAEQTKTPLDDAEVPDPIEADAPAFDDEDTFTGTIDQGNQSYAVTFTNDYQRTEVDVEKVWVDGNDQDGIRPESVQVQLKADGENYGDPATLEANEDEAALDWAYTFTDLPRYKADGTEIVYTVEEVTTDVITGTDGEGTYAFEVTGSAAAGFTVTNTHTPEVITISGEKDWDDDKYFEGDAAAIGTANEYERPASITINLLADGTQVDSKTVTADDNWAWSFEDLPKYTGGVEISYTVTEEPLDGFDPEVTGYDVKNTPAEDEEVNPVELTLEKTDANTGNLIDGAVFTLTGPTSSDTEDITVTNGSVKYQFTEPGTYTLKEKTAPTGYQAVTTEYEITVSKDLQKIELRRADNGSVWTWVYNLVMEALDLDGSTLTVPNPPTTTDVTATKIWDDGSDQDGKRPDNVTFQLYKKVGDADPAAVEGKTAQLSGQGDEWETKFENLPAYEDGQAVVYSVREMDGGTAVADGGKLGDYTAAYSNNDLTVTNSYEPEDTSVVVNKTWVGDEEWKDDVRPDSITVNLLADGEAAVDYDGNTVAPATVSAGTDGKWTYTFTNLPKYKNGEEIEYTVEEEDVDGYTYTGRTGTGTTEDPFVITNTYEPAPTTATFKVKKELIVPEGLEGPAEWEYTFNAAAAGTAPSVEETAGVKVDQDNATATFTFDDEAFKKPGTYQYLVTETGEVEGVTNDTAAESGKTVTITVTGNKNGTLTAAVSGDEDAAVTFTNTYNVSPVKVDPPVQKVIENDPTPSLYNKGNFTFAITNTAAPEGVTAPMPVKTSITNVAANELADKPGYYEFGEIEFTAPGTYTYQVTETGSAPGVTNDPDGPKTIEFVVEDDGEGGLTVTPETDQAVFTFTNTYNATGSIQLQATKNLTGRDWKTGDEFTFKLLDKNGEQVGEAKTATANAKTVTFDAIEYTLADAANSPFTYTITEDTSNLPAGVEKTSEDITATVTVADKGDGELEVSATYTSNDTIVNTYTPDPVDAAINVHKTIDGYVSSDAGSSDATFKFQLFGEDGEQIGEDISIKTENGEGDASFPAITYDKADTYKYTVKEVVESAAGFTYDTHTYDVTVTVTDNTDEGKLEAKVAYTEETDEAVNFVNTFDFKDAEVTLKLTKTIEDQSASATDSTFNFKLYKDAVSDENLVEEKSITTSGLTGSVEFGKLTFDAAGEYTYVVVEEQGNVNGMTYDTTEHTYKIIVTEDFDAAVLEVSDDSTLEAEITNIYKATATSTILKVTKAVKDTSGSAKDIEFTFTLKDADGEQIDQKSITGSGEVSFEEIAYEKAGTYKYTIQETAGDAAGWQYDTAVYDVTVKVEDKNGALQATAAYVDAQGTGQSSLTITNTYDPEDAKIVLNAKKIVEDKTGGAGGKTFTFELLDASGKVVATATRTDGGPVEFEELTFDKIGTYNYTIREVAGNDKGYTYDTNEYPVTVEVTDPGDGRLEAKVTSEEEVIITNTYEAEPVKLPLKATKVLTGRDLKAGEFTFRLLEDGEVVAEATNSADGTISFGSITFNKPGTYKYTMVEVAGNEEGMTYDTKEYPVTFTVTDDGEGTLKAEVSGDVTFTNKYTPKEEPPAPVPKTGDDTNNTVPLLAMLASLVTMAFLGVRRKAAK